MAQLNDTMVQGDLRVTGTTYSPLVRTDTILPVSYKATDNYTWGMATHEQTYGRFLWIDRHDGCGTSGVSYIITATTTGKTVNYGSTVYSNYIICDAWVPIAQNANNANQAYYAANLSYAGPNGSRASTGESKRTGSTYDSYLLLESSDTTTATKISSYAVTTPNVSAVSINASSTLSCGSGSSSVSFIPSGMTITTSTTAGVSLGTEGLTITSSGTPSSSLTSSLLSFATAGGGVSLSPSGLVLWNSGKTTLTDSMLVFENTGVYTRRISIGASDSGYPVAFTSNGTTAVPIAAEKFLGKLVGLDQGVIRNFSGSITYNANSLTTTGIYRMGHITSGYNFPENDRLTLLVSRIGTADDIGYNNDFIVQLALGDNLYYRVKPASSSTFNAWKKVSLVSA